MPVDLQIIRACEFVRVNTRGEFDLERTRRVLMALANACRKRGISRALIDVREATSNLTPNDLAALVTVFKEHTASRELRLAIIHKRDQNYRAKLFAFFSAMRGRTVRTFESFEEGLTWLSEAETKVETTNSRTRIKKQGIPIEFKDA